MIAWSWQSVVDERKEMEMAQALSLHLCQRRKKDRQLFMTTERDMQNHNYLKEE